jgi:hypothetical protein
MSDNQPTTPASPEGIQRTETGEIKSQTQTPPTATTPQTSTTEEPKPSLVNEESKSLANQPAAAGAPETYAAWNVPEGWQLDSAVDGEVKGMFKGMNLTQEQGQKLVDFYVKYTTESANQPYQAWTEMQEQWVKEVKSDPVLGPRLNDVKNTISRAIDGMNDPKLASAFREAMDYTGAGNNPAFIRTFYRLAQMVTEGKHVAGNGPSPPSQRRQGTIPTAAQAMYPNLSSSS